VKKHVLFSYSCDEITLSGVDDAYRWDFELDRPVGVLEYEIYDGVSAEPVLTGTTGYSDDSEQSEKTRSGKLDALLRAQADDNETLKAKMESYAIRDEMTEKLFEYM